MLSQNLKHFFNITGLVDPAQFPPVNEDRLTGHLGDFCCADLLCIHLRTQLSDL